MADRFSRRVINACHSIQWRHCHLIRLCYFFDVTANLCLSSCYQFWLLNFDLIFRRYVVEGSDQINKMPLPFGIGELPKDYNVKVHGPYDPSVFYGKSKLDPSSKLCQVMKVTATVVFCLNRRHPFWPSQGEGVAWMACATQQESHWLG